MLKVIVIGNSGAGKSTFSRKLRDATGLPLYYLDMLWHKSDRTNISKDVFDEQIKEIMKKSSGLSMVIIYIQWSNVYRRVILYFYWIFHWIFVL